MTEAETAVREALAKMTPGEWQVWVEPCSHPTSAIQELIQQVEHTDPFIGALYLLDAGGKCPAITGCGPTSAANAAGIVALKNHTPALLAELDAARAEVARLREALRVIGDGDYPRPIGKVYRSDGVNSKHDQCIHGVWMYDDCGQCAEAAARAALEPRQ